MKPEFSDPELDHIRSVLSACDPKAIFGQTAPILNKIQSYARSVLDEQVKKQAKKSKVSKKHNKKSKKLKKKTSKH